MVFEPELGVGPAEDGELCLASAFDDAVLGLDLNAVHSVPSGVELARQLGKFLHQVGSVSPMRPPSGKSVTLQMRRAEKPRKITELEGIRRRSQGIVHIAHRDRRAP
ncbi:MAG TPA: hypothetical protein VGO89_03440 [Streptomyces sp.]|nr:hypothetical protein [Streptomyces sp.]